MTHVDRLLSAASPPLGPTSWSSDPRWPPTFVEVVDALHRARNGFFAFESALYVRPLAGTPPHVGVEAWNRDAAWRAAYPALAADAVCFAESVFGEQFVADGAGLWSLEVETGRLTPMGRSVEAWCETLLDEWRVWTGWPVAHAWQHEHRALGPEERLHPRVPFVLGGDFATANLEPVAAAEGMRRYATLAVAIANLPDGARLTWPPRRG